MGEVFKDSVVNVKEDSFVMVLLREEGRCQCLHLVAVGSCRCRYKKQSDIEQRWLLISSKYIITRTLLYIA